MDSKEKIIENWAGWATERVGVKRSMDNGYIKYAIQEAIKDIDAQKKETQGNSFA